MKHRLAAFVVVAATAMAGCWYSIADLAKSDASVDGAAGDSGSTCTPGAQRCAGNDSIETCSSTGEWDSKWACATGTCLGGACSGSTEGSSNPSCAKGGPGMSSCGPGGSGTASCCASLEVKGGSFFRSYDDVTYKDKGYPASVSGFRLDKYEITVGRFRQFAGAVLAGWNPPAGSGIHVHLNGGKGLTATGGVYETGWDSSWDSSSGLADRNPVDFDADVSCGTTYSTWTASAGSNENKPINCVSWYFAYAFCIWDDGFLPSEAEWNYAAAGGGGSGGQRVFPWSIPSTSSRIGCAYANYLGAAAGGSCVGSGANNVGSESPRGDGAFGQADLAGSVAEWTFDGYATSYATPCVDCASLPTPSGDQVVRGGGFHDVGPQLLVSNRDDLAAIPAKPIGARCARTP